MHWDTANTIGQGWRADRRCIKLRSAWRSEGADLEILTLSRFGLGTFDESFRTSTRRWWRRAGGAAGRTIFSVACARRYRSRRAGRNVRWWWSRLGCAGSLVRSRVRDFVFNLLFLDGRALLRFRSTGRRAGDPGRCGCGRGCGCARGRRLGGGARSRSASTGCNGGRRRPLLGR